MDPSLLVGKKQPYKPCFRHPKCALSDCEYVHLPEADKPPKKKSREEEDS